MFLGGFQCTLGETEHLQPEPRHSNSNIFSLINWIGLNHLTSVPVGIIKPFFIMRISEDQIGLRSFEI